MTSLNITPSSVSSLNIIPNPATSLNITPSSVSSLNVIPSAEVTFSEIDSLTGATLNFDSSIQFGSNLEVNDFNGDGIDDLAVSAPGAGESGRTFIYFGTSSGLIFNQALDITAPGVNDVIVSGDFNGDRLSDLAIADPNSGLSGQVTIFFGTSDGLSSIPQTLLPEDSIETDIEFLGVAEFDVI